MYSTNKAVVDDELTRKMKLKLDKKQFSEWYNQVIEAANLSDKRYPIKGMNVWTPYGWKLMLNIDALIRAEMASTGHEEVCFPLLIPKTEFAKEAEHIKGFDAQVYWVTHGGETELDVPLLLRPTSETAMYPMFSLWVRAHSDLPLKTFQIVNTFRYETKQTRSFIRVREIHFFEAHTCHADEADAERQIREDLEIMKRFAKKLCLPYITTKRPDWDKFAGAYYSIGFDCILPNGRTLQLGSVHQYLQNFSKPYEIKYETEAGEHKYVYQTTYGMSERLVGAIVALHGDNRGLILPPSAAPYQLVIVPVFGKASNEAILDACRKLATELQHAGYRVHVDGRDLRPGYKYYDWELKGVPVRVEFGTRELERNTIVMVRRDTGEKVEVHRAELQMRIADILTALSAHLYERALAELRARIKTVSTLEEAQDFVGSIIRLGWCGEDECGTEIERVLDKTMLGTPVEPESEPYRGQCAFCGKPTELAAYLSRQL
jgi:prolyl-tRNA synthetase